MPPATPASTLFPYTTLFRSVNMPTLDAKTLALIGPHLRFGEKLGRFLSQLAPRRVDSLNINYSGKVDRKSTRLNSSHITNSYAVFCLKKKHLTQSTSPSS